MADAQSIDREHPWPWLGAYTREAESLFNGREAAIQELMRCVLAAPATVLFGRSGLGKTSLLQAGLGPFLLRRRMLPVFVRRLHDVEGALSGAVLADMASAASVQALEWAGAPPACGDAASSVDMLWERLHDRQRHLRDADGQRWTPVLIFDQFEEIFTQADAAARRAPWFAELAGLVEGFQPAGVHERLRTHEELLDRIDEGLSSCRVIISLREDYLPDLEVWADRIPRLGPNRYRLLPMSSDEAMRAVDITGGNLVDTDAAGSIVRFLQKQESRGMRRRPETGTVEPALLSLVCASLNQERLDQHQRKLDTANLERRGGRILERFYDDAFVGLAPEVSEQARRWVQTELITADGTRRPFPMDALAAQQIGAGTLDQLIRRRLIRIENGEQGDAVELVHDRLAAVAAERAAQAERQAAEDRLRRSKAERLRFFSVFGGLLLVGGVVAVLFLVQAYRQADRARDELQASNARLQSAVDALGVSRAAAVQAEGVAKQAEEAARGLASKAQQAASEADTQARRAKTAEGEARRVAEEATTLRLLAEGSEMAGGQRDGGIDRGILTVLAAHRMAATQSAYVRASAMGTLMRLALALDRLDWVRDGGMPISPGAPAPAGRTLLALAASLDGKWLATGDEEGMLRLWTSEGRPVAQVQATSSELLGLAFSPDGQRVVSGGADGRPHQWRVPDLAAVGPPLARPASSGKEAAAVAVAYSRDGRRILAVGSEMALGVWDVDTGAALHPATDSAKEERMAMAPSPDGRRVASLSISGELRLWDARTGLPVGDPVTLRDAQVVALAWSPDGQRIYVPEADNTVSVRDGETLAVVAAPLQGHSDAVHAVVASADGRLLATTSSDGDIRLWDAASGAPLGEPMRGHRQPAAFLAFSPDGRRLWATSLDGTLRQWAVRPTPSLARALVRSDPDKASVRALAFSRDGRQLAALSGGGSVALWAQTAGGWEAVDRPVFRQDAGSIAIGFGRNGELWLVRSGRFLTWRPGQPDFQRADSLDGRIEAVTGDGERAAVWSPAGTLQVFDIRSGRAVGPVLGPVASKTAPQVNFSPDGRHLAASSWKSPVVELWDVATGRRLSSWQLGSGQPSMVSFAMAGTEPLLAGGMDDGRVLLRLDSRAGAPPAMSLKQHQLSVAALGFDASGRWLFSGSEDKSWRLWEMSTGLPVGPPMRSHAAEIRTLAISPDGRLMASADNDGGIMLSPVLDAWVDLLCAKVSARIDPARWTSWIGPGLPYQGGTCPAELRLPVLPPESGLLQPRPPVAGMKR